MAEIVEKTILTRIINKNASLEEWSTSTLPLKRGEIALAYLEHKSEVKDSAGNVVYDASTGKPLYDLVPTYLMKVGDGSKTFKELNWLAAPASDVYGWAKKAKLDFDDLPEDVKNVALNYTTDLASKLDAQTFTDFISEGGAFYQVKQLVDEFFADDSNANKIVDRLVEIQEILDTTENAAELVTRFAAVEDWYDTYHESIETLLNEAVRFNTTEEYILDCGNHLARAAASAE